MKIGGLQRFSMLDYPGKFSAIIFTQGCNFRCPYCHNPGLVDPSRYHEQVSEEEIWSFLTRRIGKLNAVTITGGEPLLQPDLKEFLIRIKAMGYAVKLDTNGSMPQSLEEILAAKLVDYVAMDLKAPLALYQVVSQSKVDPDSITKSMHLIRKSGIAYEFRTTLFDKLLSWRDMESIKELLQPGDRYFVQQCRYTDTLVALQDPQKPEPGYLSETKLCGMFVDWGREHDVRVELRNFS